MPSVKKTATARPRKKKNIEAEIIVSPTLASAEEGPGASSRPAVIMGGEFNPTPRFYRTIALSFLTLAVILILGVFYFTLGRAEINLFLKPKNIKIDFLVMAGSGAEGQNQISGLVIQTNLSGEKSVKVKTEGEGLVGTPAPAIGKVVIYNETYRDQTLVATTRLLSPENIMFRMKKTLVVPAKGNIESDVYADKSGVESEIGPTKFTIPGLSAELQKVIFAESKDKMTGGMRFTRKLTDDDFKIAEEALVQEVVEQGKNQMIQKNSTSSLDAYIFNYSIVATQSDTKAGEEKDSFKVTAQVKLTGVFYASKEIERLLGASLRDSLSDNEVVVGKPSAPQVEFSKLNPKGTAAELKVTQEASAQISYLEDVIDKSKILSQKKTAAEEYLSSLPWIDKAEIKLIPSWVGSIPKEMSKVKIKVNQ